MIQRVVKAAAAQVNGETPDDDALLDEVTDLVEAPQALLGHFEETYLDLPMPVLIGVMKKHQRYFPVLRDGQMLPYFITVANASDLAHPDVVIAGNEGVIRARYADAAYFYRQDTERTLESYTPAPGHADLPRGTRLHAGQGRNGWNNSRRRSRRCSALGGDDLSVVEPRRGPCQSPTWSRRWSWR